MRSVRSISPTRDNSLRADIPDLDGRLHARNLATRMERRLPDPRTYRSEGSPFCRGDRSRTGARKGLRRRVRAAAPERSEGYERARRLSTPQPTRSPLPSSRLEDGRRVNEEASRPSSRAPRRAASSRTSSSCRGAGRRPRLVPMVVGWSNRRLTKDATWRSLVGQFSLGLRPSS